MRSCAEIVPNYVLLFFNYLKTILHCIDTTWYQRPRSDRLRKQFGWSEDEIIIGSLGNIRPAKGYDILLRVAALLQRSLHSCRFIIAGQGQTL